MTKHKQRNFVDQTGVHFFQCDAGIYPLISSMYRYGVKTIYSCEGDIPDLVPYEHGDSLFDHDPKLVAKALAYVMFNRDRVGNQLMSAAIGYFINYSGELTRWSLEASHTKKDGDRITLRFPHDHIMGFSSYIETVLGDKYHPHYPKQ